MSEPTSYRYRASIGLILANVAFCGVLIAWIAIGAFVVTHPTPLRAVSVLAAGAAIVITRELLNRRIDRHFDRAWITAVGAESAFIDKELQRLGIHRPREKQSQSPDADSQATDGE